MPSALFEGGIWQVIEIGGHPVHNLKSVAIAAVSCVLVAGSLSAQTGTGQVKWSGVNGAWSSYSNNGISAQWNVYTSPYKAKFQINEAPSPLLPSAGTTTFGPVSDIFCVDFNHYANTGTYNAFFTNLGSNASDVGTYTRSGVGITKYLEAAYLAERIEAVGVHTAAAADMNGAMWQIMSGSPTYRFGYNGTTWSWSSTGITNWVNAATTWVSTKTTTDLNAFAKHWVVVTDQGAAGEAHYNQGSQEYITQVTPEPATLLLMGTGLFGLLLGAALLRRPLA
jgi:hypothetical protein